MKSNNIILDKTYQFALRVVKLYGHLRIKKVERELAVQLLKSGTSIGASSKRDFIHKLEIAYGESRETRYWLRLFRDSNLLEEKISNSFIKDCEEIIKILTAILKSSKNKGIINY
ncbi:MAG: four helix bundle protein [Bacteroidetes bacterium]|jgi:four helix bundle protein|nr:four helix bundle protein [Bacteroidota bacterium]